VEALRTQHNAIPVIGVELEWYVLQADGKPIADAERIDYLQALALLMEEESLPLHSLNAERGKGQVEAALWHTSELHALVKTLHRLKSLAHLVAENRGLQTCFAAKPFSEDYGSGLHVHIHLQDAKEESLYWKKGDTLSPALAHSIGGLLASMHGDVPIFAGSEAAVARYAAGFDAPIAANWGLNNRTTALRLPDGLGDVQGLDAVLASPPSTHRRIEHRVASSEADMEAVLVAILQGIETGLRNHTSPPPPVHGITTTMGGLEMFRI
jgi:glutamine synthetase